MPCKSLLWIHFYFNQCVLRSSNAKVSNFQHGHETNVVLHSGYSRASHPVCAIRVIEDWFCHYDLTENIFWALSLSSLLVFWKERLTPFFESLKTFMTNERCFLTWSLIFRQFLWYISKYFYYLWSQSEVVWVVHQRKPRQITCLLCFWCSTLPPLLFPHTFASSS